MTDFDKLFIINSMSKTDDMEKALELFEKIIQFINRLIEEYDKYDIPLEYDSTIFRIRKFIEAYNGGNIEYCGSSEQTSIDKYNRRNIYYKNRNSEDDEIENVVLSELMFSGTEEEKSDKIRAIIRHDFLSALHMEEVKKKAYEERAPYLKSAIEEKKRRLEHLESIKEDILGLTEKEKEKYIKNMSSKN